MFLAMRQKVQLKRGLLKDIKIVESKIDVNLYAQYFLFPFLITRKFASFHYCIIGWKKKYNPTNTFCTFYYLEKYIDIKGKKVNPFVHYLTIGYHENRSKSFSNKDDFLAIAPKFKFSSSYISRYILRLILKNKKQSELFNSYFDVREYRKNLGFWKLAYFPLFLKLHYLIKGNKVPVKPSQIYEPKNLLSPISFTLFIQKLLNKDFQGAPFFNSYEKWIALNEDFNKLNYTDQLQKCTYLPLISIILPIYNADLRFLKEAIKSVKEQYYENWELCIADDSSEDQELIQYLKILAKEEKIKLIFRKNNGHISACSNSAISLAKGEFMVLLDQDDILAANALSEIIIQLNLNRNLSLLFSAEDKIDDRDMRYEPYFKKGWNYHLLLSQNYINHLCCFNLEIVRKIGGFRIGYEGSQDYDLILRFIENIHEDSIKYIDKILYHWRAIKGSTAFNIDEKNYAVDHAIKALQEHLNRTKQVAIATNSSISHYYRVKRELTSSPLVSVLIPTRNHLLDLKTAVNSVLHNNRYQNIEIIIIDNNSDDVKIKNYFDKVSEKENIRVLRYLGEFNYSAINNFAAKRCKGELILLLNNDIEAINEFWLEEMVSQILPKEVAIVGAKLIYPDNTIQHAGVELGKGGVAGHVFKNMDRNAAGDFGRIQLIQNYDAVTGACLLIKKEFYDLVGGLDEINLKVAFNDVDLCLKVGAMGKKVVYTPYAELYHHESKSRGSDLTKDNIERFNKEKEYMSLNWKIE